MKPSRKAALVRFLKIYAVLLSVVPIVLGACIWLHRDRLFPSPHSVVIYGRNGCSATQHMLETLSSNNVPYTYINIDDGYLHGSEMQYVVGFIPHENLDATSIYLPVVRVAGQLFESPTPDIVTRLYATASAR